MKKLFSLFLVAVLVLSVAGCAQNVPETTQPQTQTLPTAPPVNHKVTSPMTMPDYSVPENYTTDDLRAIAVRAMYDLVSIQWTPDKYYTYRNPYDLPNKQFHFVPEVTFAGLPYANAHTGLFQWFAYYDPQTGVMSYPGDGMAWSAALGTVCADAILWSWSTVSNSMAGKFYTFNMTPANHYIAVGGYSVPSSVEDYRNYSTARICEENGKQVMLEAYAQMKPADALTSTPKGHALMVGALPKVVRNADGTIDPEKSTVTILDQGGGSGDHFREKEVDGETLMYCGRTDAVFTFETLFTSSYIPVTIGEFAGTEPYEKASAVLTGKVDSMKSLYAEKLDTNYILCNLELKLVRANGEETRVALLQYNKAKSGLGTAKEGFRYALSDFRELDPEGALKTLGAVAGDRLVLTAQLATGDVFELATIPAA